MFFKKFQKFNNIFDLFTGNFSSSHLGNNANVILGRFCDSDEKFILDVEITGNSFQGQSMADKIKACIRKAKKAGVTVVSYSQDMGSSNIAT